MRVRGAEGRTLEVELSGPGDGPVLVFHHGTPSGGSQYPPLLELAAARGVRHLTYSRPGYAGSDRAAGRTVADCVQDVRAILDELAIDRFLTVGLSGGGPHALACAGLMPDRVIAAATIGCVAPWEAEGLDFLADIGEDNVHEFTAAAGGEEQLRPYLEEVASAMRQATGPELADALGDLISPPDRRILTDAFADYLVRSMRDGLAAGTDGWIDDDLAFVRPWGFDLAQIRRPVTIWHGEQDRFVPIAHAKWLAGAVPQASAELPAEHGHLSLFVDGFGEVLDGLLGRG